MIPRDQLAKEKKKERKRKRRKAVLLLLSKEIPFEPAGDESRFVAIIAYVSP